MNDTALAPDHRQLFETASEQAGYFTAKQALACGVSKALLAHHAKSGRFIRVQRGVYRLKDYPSSPHEDLIVAWLALGREGIVSHESALALLGLSDVVPNTIHLTIPRSQRYRSVPSGVTLHTTNRAIGPKEKTVREGLAVTSPSRSIVDAAQAGTAPEQIVLAVREALARGLASPEQLETALEGRSSRVISLIRKALQQAIEK